MKFAAIFALVATTQAVHLTATQKTEIKATAENMNQAMVDIKESMEESQKTLAELQEKFDLFNPSTWWSIKCFIIDGTLMKAEHIYVKQIYRASETWFMISNTKDKIYDLPGFTKSVGLLCYFYILCNNNKFIQINNKRLFFNFNLILKV